MAVKASYQITMADITDAYAVNLSSEAYTFTGNTSGAPSGLSCSTIVTAYCGSNACSKVSVSVSCPTGISATVSNNNTASPTITFKTTATVTSSCQATITVAVDDVTITKKFSFAVAKTGATGSTGKGISSITEEYYLSTSKTTQTGGSWTTTPPTWSSGKYVWTRSKIVYTNPSSTAYTTPICDSSWEAVNEVEVGGRNYIKNGKGDVKDGFFTNFSTVTDGYGESTLISKKTYVRTDLAPGFVLGVRDYEVGKQVTWSFDFMISEWSFPEGASVGEFWIGQRYTTDPNDSSASGRYRAVTNFNLPRIGNEGVEVGKWMHVVKTMTIPEQADEGVNSQSSIQFYNPSEEVEASITFRFKNVKLEYGNKATDWTPAPEDNISTVDVEYYLSTSTTSLSGGSWQTTAPQWVNGKYMWSRVKTTYLDGTVKYSNPTCIAGAKGDTGVGISSVTEYYAVSSSNTTAPTSWSTTVPTMTTTNRYLWIYEKTTYTDNSTKETAKRVIGVYGNTGATGATGKGISSITNYYLISSLATGVTVSTGGWSTSVKTTTTTQRYLWNYEKITYTDNTSKNTTPHIIGTHGATGSKGDKGDTGATGPAGEDGVNATQNMWIDRYFTKTDSYTWGNPAYVTYPTDVTPPVGKCMLISGRDHFCTTEKYRQSVSNQRRYRIECTAMAKDSSVALGAGIWSYGHTTGNSYSTCGTMTRGQNVSGNWYRYYYEFTPKNDPQTAALFFQLNQTAGTGTAAWYISDVTWTDITEADEAAKTATNFLKYDENGLCIGDQTGDVLGNNVLIDSNSVDIRYGTTQLATFGPDFIFLGKNNSNTIIDLCDSVGRLCTTKWYIDTGGSGTATETDTTIFRLEGENSVNISSSYSPSTSEVYNANIYVYGKYPGTVSSDNGTIFMSASQYTSTMNSVSSITMSDGGVNISGSKKPPDYLLAVDYRIAMTPGDGSIYMMANDNITVSTSEFRIQGNILVNNKWRVMLSNFTNGYYGLVAPNASESEWIRTPQPGIIPYQSGGASSLGTSSWPFSAGYINTLTSKTVNTVNVYSTNATLTGFTVYNNYSNGNIWKTNFGRCALVSLSNGSGVYLVRQDSAGNWGNSMCILDSSGPLIAAKNHTHTINELYATSGKQRILYNGSNNFIPTNRDGSSNPNVTNLGSAGNYFRSLYYGGSLSKQSDRRNKNHISDLSDNEMITILSGSKIRKFTYKNDKLSEVNYGVYAQDLRDLLIESGIGHVALLGIDKPNDEVRIKDLEEPEENVRYTVDYTQYAPVLVTGWQYNDRRIKELIERNKLLEAKIESLQYQLQQVFDKLANLEKSIGG